MDMIASFKDIWLLGWDSILVPVDALLASVGTGGLAVPVIADQYAWLLGATGMSQAIAIIAGRWGCGSCCSRCPLCGGGRAVKLRQLIGRGRLA